MKQIRASEADKPKVIPLFRRPQVRALAGLAACAVLCVGLYRGGQADLTQSASVAAGQGADVYAAAAPAAVQEADGGAAVYAAEEAVGEAMAAAQPRNMESAVNDAVAAALSAQAFANERSIPVTYGSTPEAPSARILGSADSLTAFLAQFPEDDLSTLARAYGPEFFETGRLLVVVLEEDSASIRHTMDPQGLSQNAVVIRRQMPEEGTNDIAAWLILAEVAAGFEDGENLSVVFTTVN